MKRLLVIVCMFIPSILIGAQWKDLLEQHRELMEPDIYQLLNKQYQTYSSGRAPVIADQRIKQIPIIECGEKLVDLRLVKYPRIAAMEESEFDKAHERPEDVDPRAPTHAMVRESVFKALVRMIDELDRLAPAFGYEAGDLEIRLFEGLRDCATQKELFDTKMAAIWAANPSMSEEEAYAETSKWVSPYINNVPTHSTGGAVDIHLWSNKAQAFCNMGRFNVGGSLAPTFTLDERLLPHQQMNRLLLVIAATRAGLTNYLYEFWHFSYGDRYAAYWRESNCDLRTALYGSL